MRAAPATLAIAAQRPSNARVPPPRLLHRFLFVGVLGTLCWSALAPHDRLTWALEVVWVVAGLPLVFATRHRHPLTDLAYVVLALHAVVLVVGGQYTYERVPLGNWLRDAFDLQRNHYDRLGHFAQGFAPAIWGRELLVRQQVVRGRRWLFVVVVALCLGFSAFFELIEWWAALLLGADANAYLATQGDPWDTQWDMCLALCGALVAQAAFGTRLDRAIAARPWHGG